MADVVERGGVGVALARGIEVGGDEWAGEVREATAQHKVVLDVSWACAPHTTNLCQSW